MQEKRTIKIVLFLFPSLLSFYLFCCITEGKIDCSIPPVKPNENASLTCLFPEDLNVTKKDFSVYYYTEDFKAGKIGFMMPAYSFIFVIIY